MKPDTLFSMSKMAAVALSICTVSIQGMQTRVNDPIQYPTAKREAVVDTLHGTAIEDPYRWMEDMGSTAVNDWVARQDDLLKSALHRLPGRKKVKMRITELNSFSIYSVPLKGNGKYFFSITASGNTKAIVMMQKTVNDTPVVVIDPVAEFKDSLSRIHANAVMPGFFPSPDGRKLAYGIGDGSSRWYSIRIRDLSTGKDYPTDVLYGLHNLGGSPEWSTSSNGLFYVRYDLPSEKNLLTAPAENPGIYFHALGTSQREDRPVHQEKGKGQWTYGVKVSSDGQFLLIDVRDGSRPENRIYVKRLQDDGPVLPLFANGDASYSFLGSDREDFFFYTTQNAPNGRIIGINLQRGDVYEIIPESVEAISGGSLVGGNALGYFGQTFVVTYIRHGIPVLKGFERNGRLKYTASLPIDGSIWGGLWGSADDNEVFYSFLGFTEPSTIYKLDAQTGASTRFKNANVRFDHDGFTTKQVFYTNKEGRRIPMFITHRKDVALHGTNPTLMYAYGAFNWIPFLWYQEHLLVWLELGGIYAQPSVRGGGEYGEAWHQAGIRHNRQQAVDDYISAAEWLVENRYTSPQKLVANGGSLSAPLAGVAALQRPDLFGAVILDRPALDMLRYTKFTNGSSWTSELGDPDIASDFEFLIKQSPYHLVRENTCYPPWLIMTGNLDQVTPPAHAYKFTARMQAGLRCNPILLKMMWGAGHSFGSTREQIVDSRTDQIMFLIKYLNLKYD
jgi:prolyl oligopeptidase